MEGFPHAGDDDFAAVGQRGPQQVDGGIEGAVKPLASPLQGGTLAGIGFALTTQAGIVAVDLDDCLVDGIIQPWAAEIVRAVGCYVELSPSGRGLHIFMRGKLPWPGKRTKQIEIYSHARYLTVTGRWVRTEGIFDAAA